MWKHFSPIAFDIPSEILRSQKWMQNSLSKLKTHHVTSSKHARIHPKPKPRSIHVSDTSTAKRSDLPTNIPVKKRQFELFSAKTRTTTKKHKIFKTFKTHVQNRAFLTVTITKKRLWENKYALKSLDSDRWIRGRIGKRSQGRSQRLTHKRHQTY